MKAEELRSALQEIPQETLADTLALVFSERAAPTQELAGMNKPELANFAQALMYLKKHYGFEELEHFSCEADLVYVQAGDRRVLLSDRMGSPQPAASVSNGTGGESNPAFEKAASPEADGGRFSNLEI
jgi:hypothetical protein